MGITGIQPPKFETLDETTTVLLDNALIYSSNAKSYEIEHESLINGVSNYVPYVSSSSNKKISYTVLVYLCDYPQEDQLSKYLEIYAYEHQNVYFWEHRDGSVMKDDDGNKVEYHISSVDLKPLNDGDNVDDIIIIQFDPVKFVNMGQTLS